MTQIPAEARLAEALAAFADVLIPGTESWPSGGAVGVQHAVIRRFAETRGDAALPLLAEALAAIGAPFAGVAPEAATAAVANFERVEPALFGWLRDTAYHAYYEDAGVVALIAARGTPYKLRPHLTGYDLPKFDPATQTPTHGRGRYIATEDVRPVDISGLELDTRITTNWGLQR